MNRRPAAGAHACVGEGLTPKAKILARAIVPLGRRARHRTELRLRRNVQRRTKRGWRLEAATVLDRDVRNRRMPADEDRNAGHWRNLATPTVGSSPRSSLEPEDNEAHLREQAHLPQPAAELALLSAGSHHRALSLLHNEAQDPCKNHDYLYLCFENLRIVPLRFFRQLKKNTATGRPPPDLRPRRRPEIPVGRQRWAALPSSLLSAVF